ncbi:Glycosyltransferase like family 2 [compost metagenome]
MLTIITPFYTRNREDYLYERVRRFIKHEPIVENLQRIIVDFGSPAHIVDELAELCSEKGLKFLALNRRGEPFSIGACRNAGVQLAETEFISFQDVDLTAPPSVYRQLLENLRAAPAYFNHLESIPCLYLTELGTDEYVVMDPESAKATFHQYFVESDSDRIQMYAPATSAIVTRREFYLAMGGVRQEFFGHGYEDFEMMNRLAWKSRRFIRSHDYYSHDYKYGSLEYKGYRTFFSLFGRQNMASGLFFSHLHHPTPPVVGYSRRNAANRTLFEHFAKALDKDAEIPPALSDLTSGVRTLALSSRTSVPMKSIRMAIANLGEVIYMEPTDFEDKDAFLTYVRKNKVDQILFLTPYGNEQRLELYYACRQHDIPYFVFDRGALPRSWFFDPSGFNADSASYSPEKWDSEMSVEARERTERYIDEVISSENTLEENGERVGADNLRAKYNLHGKKLLFVPMQRPADSVIRYFASHAESVDNFCFVLSQLTLRLPSEWRIVVKRHPLETAMPPIPGAIVLDPSTHVYDALAASDAVLAINSGVGLLSLLFDKPTFNMGSAFYCHKGLSAQVSGLDDILAGLATLQRPSREAVLRFTRYLSDEFYSFADTEYKKISEKGASRNVAVNLDFTHLRLPVQPERAYIWRTEPAKKSSPVYDFYRTYIANMGKKTPVVAKAPVVAPTKTVPATQKSPANSSVTNKLSATRTPIKVPSAVQATTKNGRSNASRKFAKLVRDPKLFFADALRKRLA